MNLRLPLVAFTLTASALLVAAQPPAGGKGGPKKAEASPSLIDYVLSFGKKKTGQVAKDELTDRRMWTIFELADVNKDGIVTRDEITTLANKFAEEEKAGVKGSGKGKGPPK